MGKEKKMKNNRLQRFACLVIGLVMLASAMPMSAIVPFSSGEVKAVSPTVSEGYINAVLRDFDDLSAHATDAVKFTTSKAKVVTESGTSNKALTPSSTDGKMHLIISDLKGEAMLNGFVYSADYKFGENYFNLTEDETDVGSCVQAFTFVSGYQTVARFGHDGALYSTLSGNTKITDVIFKPNKWFNFRLEMLPNGTSSFSYYIYIDDVLVYWGSYGKKPAKTPAEFRILAADRVSGTGAMLDNVCFRTLPLIPDPDRVDITVDFEALSGFGAKQWLNATNMADAGLNTSGAVVGNSATSWNMSAVTENGNTFVHNRVINGVVYGSAKMFFTINDVENRLIHRDFTVSSDFIFYEFPTQNMPIIQWLYGADVASAKATQLINIDQTGMLIHNGKQLGVNAGLNEWFNVTLKVKYLASGKYRINVYVDEKYVTTSDLAISYYPAAGSSTFFKFLSTGHSGFRAGFDNLQIYEADTCKVYAEKDVIWDVDFDKLANGTQMDINAWNSVSEGYNVIRSNMGESAVIENGKLKLTPNNSGAFMDINIGGGNYDPMKEGSVEVSFKLNISQFDSTYNQRIVTWRRINGIPEISAQKTCFVLELMGSTLKFMGRVVDESLELNKDYDIKMVIDGYKNHASIIIDGKKVIDSLPIATYASAILGENLTYVTDDAGNRHYLPYSGFISEQKYDADGNAVANSYVKRFVESAGYSVDTLRLFQTSDSNATATFLVDDFKVERVDVGNEYFSTDFTGWSVITDQKPGNTNSKTDGYVYFDGSPTIKTDEDGNEYLNCEGVQRMFIGNRRQELLFETFELSFDMYYTKLDAPSSTGKGSFVNVVGSKVAPNETTEHPYSGKDPYDEYANPLKADEQGNLYDKTNALVCSGIDGKWTNVRMVFIGDGTKYTGVEYYINGKYIHTAASDISSSFKDFVIRILPNNKFALKLDNVKVNYVIETEDFLLDFDGDYETMLDTMGNEYRYPAIGSTRTDANGGIVTSAQVLGDSDKYLRIDRTLLAANQDGYISIDNSKYINEKEYIVETDFRFSCDAGFGITPVTIFTKGNEKQFAPVQVKGAYNTLSVSVRGALYDLYNSSGKLLKVKTTDDKGFTKLAVLINENDLTYTVYVDKCVAYYYYDGKYIPCANLPITYKETGTSTATEAGLRLMEIDGIKHNYSIIDIDRIAVIPAPSGIASDIRATQSKINISKLTFDIRFIAGIDSLYGNLVGYIVETTYTDGTEKHAKKEFTSNLVYSSIEDEAGTVDAGDLNSGYLFVMSVTALPITSNDTSFKVTPFVEHGGVRSLGKTESFIVNVVNDRVIVK